MHSRRISRGVGLGLAAILLAAAAAACGGATLSDPKEIATKSEAAMGSVQSAHVQIEAAGQMVVGVDETAAPSVSASGPAGGSQPAPASPSATATPTGTASEGASASPAAEPSGPSSTAIPLDGTAASGDVDFANSAAHFSGKVPALHGVDGELIVIGSQGWTRTTGDQGYHTIDPSTLPINPADGSQVLSMVQSILQLAADPSLHARLVGTEKCTDGDCYHLSVPISAQSASQLIGSSGTAFGQGTVDLWILHDGYRVARFEFHSSDPTAGTIGVRFLFTNYDRHVEIQPPPGELVYPS